ncbi:MAG: glycosyltransferase [candidate division Zixibacteria bacterium]|nr:glycosyltransferase [candidate division Zixibacteria bacterium]
MRILFLSEAISPHIARWQKAFTELGWETLVASCDYTDSFSGHRLLPKAGSGPQRYLSIVDQVEKLASDFQPHLINAHFLPTYGLTAAMANIHPLVLTLWGSDILLSAQSGFLRRWRSRFVLRRSDLVVADAQNALDVAKAFTAIRRQLVVSFGVSRAWYESGQVRELKETNTLQILSCRKFEPLYDVQTLIKAAWLLRDDGFKFHLTLIGSGSLEDNLRALAHSQHLADHVTFTGALGDEQLFNAYRRSDIYVSTALSDTTSVSLLEAMSQKLYPIVTDIPGTREWLTSDRYFFRPGDAADLAGKIKLGASRQAREQAYLDYQPLLTQKGIRDDQMRIADLTFRKLIDEYPRR